MTKKETLTLLPNMTHHHCFGCGPKNEVGLKMDFYRDENDLERISSYITLPGHLCGWENIVHGGIQTTVLDEVMSRVPIFVLKKASVTKSLNVEFRRPIFVEKEYLTQSWLKERLSEREALLESAIFDDNGDILTHATGVFSLFDVSMFRAKGATDERTLNWLEEMIKTF